MRSWLAILLVGFNLGALTERVLVADLYRAAALQWRHNAAEWRALALSRST